MISEQRIIELGWEYSNEFDDEVKFSKDGLFAFANALQAEWIKSLGEPVAWQFSDAGKWFNGSELYNHKQNTIDGGYKVRELYTLPNEEVK